MVWRDLIKSVAEKRSYDARFYKPVCLISVLDALNQGQLTPDRILPDVVLGRFHQLVGAVLPDRADLGWEPLWHLSNDGAWTFYKDGKVVTRQVFKRGRPKTKRSFLNNIDCAAVPTDMTEVWRDPQKRNALRLALLQMLERDNDQESTLMVRHLRKIYESDQGFTEADNVPASRGESWTEEEVRATVADYFEMRRAESEGKPYNKAQHNAELRKKLHNRSRGSVELKHSNISAILNKLGWSYIHGYKPRKNYQHLLEQEVQRYLAQQSDAQFQQEVEKELVSRKSATVPPEPPGPEPPPPALLPSKNGKGGYPRSSQKAAAALRTAGYQCEIDSRHKSFTSSRTGNNYVEVHHLVPFKQQEHYPVSLDVPANLVSLCPNCHRLVHHAKNEEREQLLVELLNRRKVALEEKGISIKQQKLLQTYRSGIDETD